MTAPPHLTVPLPRPGTVRAPVLPPTRPYGARAGRGTVRRSQEKGTVPLDDHGR